VRGQLHAPEVLLLLLLFNCNWAYARWQRYKNWMYIQEMDIHSKETKHTTHKKAARTTHEKTALPPGKDAPVPTGKEFGWAPQPFSTTWRRENF
jgi:hypothetical protein